MATPINTRQGTVRSTLTTQQQREQRLPLALNHQFRFWVAPERVRYHSGVCRYNPVEVAVVPGIHNVPESGDPTTIDGLQENRHGRTMVPMDFELVAWGQKSKGYMCELEVGTDAMGKVLLHYHNIWIRYEKLGSTVVRTFDGDGWADFCIRVEKLMGGPPHQAIQDAERSRLMAMAEQHRRSSHVSPGGMANAAMIEAALRLPAAEAK